MANIDSREENNNFCAIQFDYFRGMEAFIVSLKCCLQNPALKLFLVKQRYYTV